MPPAQTNIKNAPVKMMIGLEYLKCHNERLRSFYPKQMAVDKINEKDMLRATNLMNNRPKKVLEGERPCLRSFEVTGQDYFFKPKCCAYDVNLSEFNQVCVLI